MNLKGKLRFNEVLAPYNSWHIGGPAEIYYKPLHTDDLSLFLKAYPHKPVTFLGLGSNVLIADEGLKGLVIHWLDTQRPIEILNATTLRIDTRLPCAKVAKFCAKYGFKNAEFFAGIPGTLGGALAMNAGAWGRETWSCVSKVQVINREGRLMLRDRADYEIAYRHVKGPNLEEWFVEVECFFEPGGEPEAIQQTIKSLLKQRQQSQPIGVFSCGSVFKNPPHDYAGRLIEACGLKGYQIGGAQISEKHANFIINVGLAKASDVQALIKHIQEVVFQHHGVYLDPEVRFLLE